MADIKIIVDSSDVLTADNRLDKLGKSGSVAGKGVDKASRGMNQFGKVSNMGGKKLNTFNMQIQQGGYQLQDFAVQLQSGTSFFTAFGQQGSQFAGVFGPQGAVIGAVIAIGSAVGGMAYNMAMGSKDVESLEDSLKSLKSAVDDYAKASKEALQATKSANDEFGFTSDTLEGIIATMALIAETKAFDQVGASIKKLREEHLHGFQGDLENIADLLDLDGWFAELSSESTGFNALLKTMENDALSIGDRIKAAISLKDIMLQNGGSYADMTGLQKSFFDDLVAMIKKMEELRGLQGGDRESAEEDAARFQSQVDAEQAIFDANNKYEAEQNAERRELDAAGDKAILEAKAKLQKDLFDANAKYEARQKALDAAGDKAILNTQANAERALGAANSKYEAEQAALRLREQTELNTIVADMATRLALPFAQVLGLIRQAKAEASMSLDAFGGGGDFKYEDAQTITPVGFGGGLGGGGGIDPREQLADYLKEKQQELDLETQLVGIFGAERQIQTELFNTKNQYSDIITGKQEDELEGILRLTQAERERQEVVEEASAKQQSIADTLQSSMSNAFMSMVDGTKSFSDAMKDMARSVIKQLFDILVVQRLVGSFDSNAGTGSGIVGAIMGAFQADGGAWSGGSQVQAYANGGVVNGPTNFPMSGNKVGLMGEDGAEAIMPLKRGANGKLGVQAEGSGGGDVINIHQSFNFQANGDETVKKLIAQAAPKIAQMTKTSMIDDRRRGGVTKSAFG